MITRVAHWSTDTPITRVNLSDPSILSTYVGLLSMSVSDGERPIAQYTIINITINCLPYQ